MTIIGILLYLIAFVMFLIVLGDMFKKKVWLGLLGLLIFPITFIYAFTHYSGRRLLVGSILLLSWVIPYAYIEYQLNIAEEKLRPFVLQLEQQGELSCVMGGAIHSSQGMNSFELFCDARSLKEVKYSDIDELIAKYSNSILRPAIADYMKLEEKTMGEEFTIGILSPSNIYACFKVKLSGDIESSWSTGEKDECET